jgi:hypothetical protein
MNRSGTGGMRRTLGSLTKASQELVAWMQRLEFGRIEHLAIRGGEPILASARIVREIKLGVQTPEQEWPADNFELKLPVIELFERLEEIRDGEIDLIEIRHGLPFRLVLEHRHRVSQGLTPCRYNYASGSAAGARRARTLLEAPRGQRHGGALNVQLTLAWL